MPTSEAPFLDSGRQPLILSPDGLRTVRWEVDAELGLALRVEPGPAFGPESSVTTVATKQDVVESVLIIPREALGTTGVKDLFWLDDRCFLATGFKYNRPGLFFGAVADLRVKETKFVPKPSEEARLFVPLDLDNTPLKRVDKFDKPEVLLGFAEPMGNDITWPGGDEAAAAVNGEHYSWFWYNVFTTAMTRATVHPDLPCELWREVVVSRTTGEIEVVMLLNGTVYRRPPPELAGLARWDEVGSIQVVTSAGVDPIPTSTALLPQKHLVGIGPDGQVFAVDVLREGVKVPVAVPPLDYLRDAAGDTSSLPGTEASDEEVAAWVLKESLARQTVALVQLSSAEELPQPLFAHPFADVAVGDVWWDDEAGSPEAVTVDDLRPHAHGISATGRQMLDSLKRGAPVTATIDNKTVALDGLEPNFVSKRGGGRWVVAYSHPMLAETIAVAALVENHDVSWMGTVALPVLGCAVTAAVLDQQPRTEAHRIRVEDRDVPLELIMPSGISDAGALVVRTHERTSQDEGVDRRAIAGADAIDGWLLSRGYGVLKVNYRGSAGFGRRWGSAVVDGTEPVEDLAAAVRWALQERKVLGAAATEESTPSAVAIWGSAVGGGIGLAAMAQHPELFACGVVAGPVRHPTVEGTAPPIDAAALRRARLLVLAYEKDRSEVAALPPELLDSADPDFWSESLYFVEYAGESFPGGNVRQNALDQYRRIDYFLFDSLSSLSPGKGRLLREPFVDEVPFLSTLLLPAPVSGRLSQLAQGLETSFTQGFADSGGKQADDSFPKLEDRNRPIKPPKSKRSGFGAAGAAAAGKSVAGVRYHGRRKGALAPACRFGVHGDTVEVTIRFAEEPAGLHVLLNGVWLHIRSAEGLGCTLALPRKPRDPNALDVSRLQGSAYMAYVIEIPVNDLVGAIENYQEFQRVGGKEQRNLLTRLLATLGPEQFAAAPTIVASG